jgi:hypothetical protein
LVSAAVPESVTIPAVPEQIRKARAFVARVLGESHAHTDLALLLSSELVTNSVRHSGSAVPDGAVAAGDRTVRVDVTHQIGAGVSLSALWQELVADCSPLVGHCRGPNVGPG